ncbi:alpha/beta fold hydrolase [Clostridium sp.]|jgi:esterase/lipase|uniref:alpha/beta fold hydrolase n=1 Tax=Clostridium sp. TaxID=1506 RepID=UPI00258FD74E|nr:alpha/beta fold hydrolase [Clostridium sp.]MDF2503618.1 hypothetical protein [Clostridium sp.]
MDIRRQIIKCDGFTIPTIILTPSHLYGSAIVIHGYGGSKEEQLGLAYRVAETGFKTFVIDLRGHGENELCFDEKVMLDVEAAIQYCRPFGKVTAIGHSMGGRLALISSADYAIGISPALDTSFGKETQKILSNVRDYRISQLFSGELLEVLKKIPTVNLNDNIKKSIIYGSRDIPEIISSCNILKSRNLSVTEINNALHSDIFTLEITFQNVVSQLKKYYFNGN